VTRPFVLALGLACALLTLLGAVRATPASAESCFQTLIEGKGSYTSSACSVVGAPKDWVWGSNTFNWEATTMEKVYCVKVRAGNASWYEDVGCDKPKASTGEYSEIWAEAGFLWGINPIVARGKGSQVIDTTAGAVECEELKLSGEAKATEEKTQILTAKYSNCKGFGSKVTVSEAELEFGAEGTLGIVNKNITVTDSEGGCSVTIPSGGSDKSLEKVAYTNTAEGKIIANGQLNSLDYEPSGGACGTKKLETNGTYKGEVEIEQEGKSIAVELHSIEVSEKEQGEKEDPLILPSPTKSAPLELTATVGKTVLESVKAKVECKEGTASGSFTASREGTTSIDLHGCKSTGIACHSTGDATEVILISANVELVDLEKSKLLLAMEIALKELHVECGGVVSVVVKGGAIGEASGIESGKKAKSGTLIFKQEKGKQAIKECLFTKAFCEGKKFLLEASLNGGAFEEAGLETEEKLTFSKEAAFDF